ncbi:MAG: YitT family protein [Bacteroidales bacterium]|jgi:uncharacterized membrane-anchored protein YitT (DUF2179 family)|nr:YitT family protein [Bacteroidales bacterium]
MAQRNLTKDKLFSKDWFISYGLLTLGTFILSFGYAFFMSPYKIVPGGIYGISIILHHQLGFPLGMSALCFNLPLTLIGLKILGPRFGAKTFACFLLTAFFTDSLPYVFGENPLHLDDEVLLASIFGGVVMGIGVGLIFKTRSSSGGTDVLASILSRYTHIPLGQQLMIIDSCIVLLGFIVFKDWKVPLYSLLTIFIMGKVIDIVMQGFASEKTLFIISNKTEEIRDVIINDLGRGGTLLDGKGMYSGQEKEVIFITVSRREVVEIQKYISKIDPSAFMVIINANEILGEGFKSLQKKIED